MSSFENGGTNISDYKPAVNNNSAINVPIYQTSTQSIIIGFVGPSLIIVSSMSCFVILNTYLKKLHKCMKNFLITLSIHNFIFSLLSIAQILYIFFSESQNFVTCSIWSQSWIPVSTATLNSLPILSFMRYHIASKTAENEAIDTDLMIKLVTMSFTIEHLMNIIWNLLSYYFQIPFWTRLCSMEENNGVMIFQAYAIIKLISIIAIGVGYDVFLMKFLKKQNKKLGPGQAKLIKWKSTKEQEYSFSIPISAAVVSMVSMVATVGMIFCIVVSFENTDYMGKAYFECCLSIQMPLMLALTLKAAKHKKPLPKIPQKPMFHDDPYLEEENNKENDDVNAEQHAEDVNEEQARPSPSRMIMVKPAPDAESHM